MAKGNIITAIDELGRVRAQISDLRKREADLVKEITPALEQCDPANQVIDGELFAARLVTQIRETLIAEKVRELLHANTLRACTRVTNVSFVKIDARSAERLKVAA